MLEDARNVADGELSNDNEVFSEWKAWEREGLAHEEARLRAGVIDGELAENAQAIRLGYDDFQEAKQAYRRRKDQQNALLGVSFRSLRKDGQYVFARGDVRAIVFTLHAFLRSIDRGDPRYAHGKAVFHELQAAFKTVGSDGLVYEATPAQAGLLRKLLTIVTFQNGTAALVGELKSIQHDMVGVAKYDESDPVTELLRRLSRQAKAESCELCMGAADAQLIQAIVDNRLGASEGIAKGS